MNLKSKNTTSPIQKKLATIRWNLKLLQTSVQITHTPLRTLKSMIKSSAVIPTHNLIDKVIRFPITQSVPERLTEIRQLIRR